MGVLAVGAWSIVAPAAFPEPTVWSHFGSGYGFVPLVLPVLGLLWQRRRPSRVISNRDDRIDAICRDETKGSAADPASFGFDGGGVREIGI